jgi:hypothetical protein
MDRSYDIFEKLPNGKILWRGCVHGLDIAHAKVYEFGRRSRSEFFAIHTPTHEIVARVNECQLTVEQGRSDG